jgi:4-amino-4-deoxy-L-arabinose transferase-like glycosyltransferase
VSSVSATISPVTDHRVLPPLARLPVLGAAAAQAAVLLLVNDAYGYHRDELYFRMLHPAWGYVDQPPLTPLIARAMGAVGDSPWVLRLPAVLAAALAVVLIGQLTREVGGDRGAQAFAAWSYAFASFPLVFGHTLLTNSIDTPVWLAVLVCIVRAQLRSDGRWWVLAGVVVGFGFYNKLLILVLLAALAVGILITGPRRLLVSRPVLLGIAAAIIVGAPNIVYQAVHGWPQLTFGEHLSAEKAGDTRGSVLPLLALMLGPPLTVVWFVGLVAIWRRPQWRPIRFVAAALPVLVVITLLLATQATYPFALVAAVFAIGSVPTVQWWRRGWLQRARKPVLLALVGVNVAVSALIALPLVPVRHLGATPIPGINQAARDTVGWRVYAGEVAAVYRQVPSAQQAHTVLFASNYGEAGALQRYGPGLHLPRVYSAHNALYDEAKPPKSAVTAVVVGGQADDARRLFATCRTAGYLDNRVDVDNEEQDEPIAICSRPNGGWRHIWPQLHHQG